MWNAFYLHDDKEVQQRNIESTSLQAIPSIAAEIPISKGPRSPLKLCAFVRVSDARDGRWGGDDDEDRDCGGDDIGDGGWVGFMVYKLILFLNLIFIGSSNLFVCLF